MYSLPLAFLLFVAYLLIVLGASFLAGRLFNLLVCFNRLPKQFEFVSGFAFFPVIISYIGLSGLGKIIPFVEALALMCAIAGGYWIWMLLSQMKWRRPVKEWLLLISVPAVALTLLVIGKYCYLAGGSNFSDEFRSIHFIGSFATNSLKPAFPYDFSLPLSYSYYFFEGGAFLYAAARGLLSPSIALLATTLVSVAVAYRILYLICTELFASHLRSDESFGRQAHTLRKYFLVSAVLTFSSLDGLVRPIAEYFGVNLLNQLQFHPINAYFHNNYQYLLSIGLCSLGVLFGMRYLREKKMEYWFACAAFFSMALGYATITFLWAAIGFGFVLLLQLRRKEHIVSLLKAVPGSLAIMIVMLLPQFAIFLPRLLHVAELSFPHLWFPYDANFFIRSAYPNVAMLLHLFSLILTDLGPLLTAGVIAAPVLLLLRLRKGRHPSPDEPALMPFAIIITVVLMLMTVTWAPVSDWFVRGFFVAQYLSAFFVAAFADALLMGKYRTITVTIGMLLLCTAGASFVIENAHATNNCKAMSPEAAELNVHYPLGTIFLVTEDKDGIVEANIRNAGRALINPFNKILSSYLNAPDFLQNVLGVKKVFIPCASTPYGLSTPEGKAMVQTETGWTEARCKEEFQ